MEIPCCCCGYHENSWAPRFLVLKLIYCKTLFDTPTVGIYMSWFRCLEWCKPQRAVTSWEMEPIACANATFLDCLCAWRAAEPSLVNLWGLSIRGEPKEPFCFCWDICNFMIEVTGHQNNKVQTLSGVTPNLTLYSGKCTDTHSTSGGAIIRTFH